MLLLLNETQATVTAAVISGLVLKRPNYWKWMFN